LISAEVVDGEDVRMVQLGNGLGFSFEAGQTINILSHSLMQHLDCHIPIQPLVVRPVDLAHPALADLLDDAIVPEGATDEVSHCWGSQRAYGIAAWGMLGDPG
jgi:hypothetical protein